MEFQSYPKTPRLEKEVIVTEKIDGTNAQIHIEDVTGCAGEHLYVTSMVFLSGRAFLIRAGSRKRYVTPEDDNFGFAAWVRENAEELVKLGPGRHYGEWWGRGIQRGYGLEEKRFSLFNVDRWSDAEVRPACCHVVPVLSREPFDQFWLDMAVKGLEIHGSAAAPGFDRPEGVIVYHTAANQCFKAFCEGEG